MRATARVHTAPLHHSRPYNDHESYERGERLWAGFRKKHAKLAPCKAALEPVWQIARSSRQQALGPPLAEFADSFGDTSKPCFGCFGSLDGEHNPLLGASGQSIEELRGRRITVESVLEVGGHRHLTRFGVQLDIDLYFIASLDTSTDAVLCADGEQELPTHRCHRAAVGMTVDCDADWWPLA